MDSASKNRVIAIAVTAVAAIALLLWLLLGSLASSLKPGRKWPPERHSEIILEPDDELFITTIADAGDQSGSPYADDTAESASNRDSEVAPQNSDDIKTAGSDRGDKTDITTSNTESTVKEKTDNKPTGVTDPEAEARAKAEAERRQSEKNAEQVKGRWSNDGGKGKKNDNPGKSDQGGSGGGSGLQYTASVDERPASNALGTIAISVIVMPDGTVQPGSASFSQRGSNNQAATMQSLIQSCIKAAYKCRFPRKKGETSKEAGTIFFKWEDKK